MQLVPWASWSFVPGHPPGAVISPNNGFFFASVRAVGMGTNGSAPAAWRKLTLPPLKTRGYT